MIPAELNEALFWALVVLSALTSFVTAAFGAGGGALLLAVLALVLPSAAIIPVHGLVQLGSNLGRFSLSLRHVHWPTLAWFGPFSLLGSLLAAGVLVQLPLDWLRLAIAGFLLYLCWGPPLPWRVLGRAGIALAALVTGFLSPFLGASGPLVAAFLKAGGRDRLGTVATFAGAMCVQHGPKALIFALAGFVFSAWLPLVLLMIASGLVGTWLGLRLLARLGERHFTLAFNLVLTLLALRLLW
ncbi:sulfite exporter TauE/SafE family protein [Gallaecimonas sp. GXIMD4217]|uniref:sulfite exporter TauE/SafE family protein n=1 Tax=Gallaecimonas sp. GXIMD4217 TaxID=3131927 RepID=UPI00311AC4D3